MTTFFDSEMNNSLLDPVFNMHFHSSCQYCTVDEYNINSKKHGSSSFSLFNQNIQSFNAKKSKLEAFLGTIEHEFHSIVLTETWNHENYSNLCFIENVDAVHTSRINNNSEMTIEYCVID